MKKIKLIILALVLFGSSAPLFAQDGFNYQATLRNNNGSLKVNENVTLRFQIRKNTSGGTNTYDENHSVTTNDYGGVSVVVGKGTATNGTFNAIDWSTGKHFLRTFVDGTNAGTREIHGVPYANSAGNVQFESDGTYITQKDVANQLMIGTSITQGNNKVHITAPATESYSELVDIKATNILSNNDVLNLEVQSGSSNTAQFIEASQGTNVVYQLNANGDIITEGEVRRESTGAANLVPVAYGMVNNLGNIQGGNKTSQAITVTNTSAGRYDITIPGETYNTNTHIAQLTMLSSPGLIRAYNGNSAGTLRVFTYNTAGVASNRAFYFIVYKP